MLMQMRFQKKGVVLMTLLEERVRADALSGADRDVSLLAHDQYFRQLAWTEPMSDEEQEKLLHHLRRGNAERSQPSPNSRLVSLAKQARDRLLEAYQPLVVAVVRRRLFLFTSMELIDVIQEANVGLLEAFERYGDEQAARGPFRFYVISGVKNALSRALSERDVIIRLPQPKFNLCIRREIVAKHLEKHLGRQPSFGEIAEELGVTEEVLRDAVEAGKQSQVKSLHRVIGTEDVPEDKEQFSSLYGTFVAVEDQRQKELAATFQRVLEAAMPEKQREIVTLRYGFGEGCGPVRPVPLVADTNPRTVIQ